MPTQWNQTEPIFRQLADRLRNLILKRVYAEGEAMPSVRQLSADLRINPITISKSLQILVDEGLIEKRRGIGMFVANGATSSVLDAQRSEFIEKEWPGILEKLELLGLQLNDLPKTSVKRGSK